MRKLYTILLSFMAVGVFAQSNVVPDQTEFNALKALWESTGGSTWKNNTGWPKQGSWPSAATAAQMAGWYGITVSNGDIKEIVLNNNDLSGELPALLGTLTKLEALRVQNNKLKGSIPSELGSLTNLLYFYVNENQLTGSIPSSFSALNRMAYFDVHLNQLSGSLPPIFTGMTYLNSVFLNDNRFIGSLPALRGQNIYVQNNLFTGTFPDVQGNTVVVILANNNSFTAMPSNVASLSNLLRIDFTSNQLTTLPSTLASRSDKANIQLMVSNNRLDFSVLESFTGFKSTSVLIPQKNIVDYQSKAITLSGAFSLNARTPGAMTTIKWYKQLASGSWNEIATAINYSKTSATLDDEGIYQWRSTTTKSGLTGVTIQSDPITVKTAMQLSVDSWAFQYKYDYRKRMTHKKVPGADWLYMVYDDRDRLVMTQDGEQRRVNKWSVTKYDFLNRPIIRAVYTHTKYLSQSGMDSLISKVNYSESFNGTGITQYTNTVFPTSNLDVLTVSYYDNYSFLAAGSELAYKSNELSGQYKFNSVTNASYPLVTGKLTGSKTKVLEAPAPYYLLSVSYYDEKGRVVQSVAENYDAGLERVTNNFDFVGKITSKRTTHSVNNITWKNINSIRIEGNSIVRVPSSGSSAGAQSVQYIPANTDGWVEATVTETDKWRYFGFADTDPDVLPTSIDYAFYMNGANLYVFENGTFKYLVPGGESTGDKLRIWRQGTTVKFYRNGELKYTSATPSTTVLYADVSMQTNLSKILNINLSNGRVTQTTLRIFDYNHAGQLLSISHSVNNGDTILLAKNIYNEIGQLVDKKLHSTNSTEFHQSLDYKYNIRGWLASVNGAELGNDNGKNSDSSTEKKDLFGFDLLYNDLNISLGNSPLYNGNISAMRWSLNLGLSQQEELAYKFDYDSISRLSNATQKVFTNSIWHSSSAYRESGVTYDLNGNIKTLLRTDGSGILMDSLKYDYGIGYERGNALMKVGDSGNKSGFTDVTNGDNDYKYDNNGNLLLDRNKNITSITYNLLNLPSTVIKGTGESILYFYDATGRKLSQVVRAAGDAQTKQTDYHGEFIYENDSLKFVNTEEGRVILTTAVPEYQYHLRDHLGNVRMTFTTKDEVDSAKATMELSHASQERSEFLNYNSARFIYSQLFDRTNGGSPGYSQRLSGTPQETTGLVKTFSVMPGDVIEAQVYVKYFDKTASNLAPALQSLLSSLANPGGSGGVVVDGGSYGSSSAVSLPGVSGFNDDDEDVPNAYLAYIYMNREYDASSTRTRWKALSVAALEDGTGTGDHELLTLIDTVKEAGYVSVYLRNDEVGSEVYFDDFRVEHVKSAVIESSDYYPFGLTFNNYRRENSLSNQIKFQGQEHQDELDLGWDAFKWRNHMPEIGRFFNVDPLSEKYVYNSPYAFSENQVVAHRELEGLEKAPINEQTISNVNAQPAFSQHEAGVVTHFNVTFTVTQYEHATQYDENNVAVATVEKTTTSTHSIRVGPNGAPGAESIPKDTHNILKRNPMGVKNFVALSANGVTVTNTTPISTTSDLVKPKTSVSQGPTGPVTLSQNNTKLIRDAAQTEGTSGKYVFKKYIHFIFFKNSNEKKKDRLIDDGAPRR